MDRKMKIGIIGAGNRGINCFGRLIGERTDAKVTALCDTNPTRMKAQAEVLGITPSFWTDSAEMLTRERFNAVIITSPDHCHEAHAILALRHGVHVLIDKPLATTVKGCQAIIQAANSSKKVAMLGFNLRCHDVLIRLKKIIDEGVLGRVFLIENREFYNNGRTYLSRWNRFYEKSGGLWIHKGSHDFDIFNWLLNFPKPKRVTAFAGMSVFKPENLPFCVRESEPVGPACSKCAYTGQCPDAFPLSPDEKLAWGDSAVAEDGYIKDLCMYLSEKDTHDNGIAMVEYENGVRASHAECFVTSLDDRLYTVVGDRGMAEVSLTQRTIVIRPRWKKEVMTHQIPNSEGGHGGADPELVDRFFRIIRGELDNTTPLEHGLWATAIGQAAEISCRENRLVQVRELFE